MFKDKVIPEMFLEIRQSKNNDWRELVMTNITGYDFLSKDLHQGEYVISLYGCYAAYACQIQIVASVTLRSCTIEPELYSVFRCKVYNGSQFFKSPERSIVSTKGQSPREIRTPTIIRSSNGGQTSVGVPLRAWDVVQIQCIGEIESINGVPSQNIRWCKKTSGKFTEITLQDPPNTVLVWSSRDGCTNIQKSEIFYHIMKNDTNFEIMCESGYNTYNAECGQGSAKSTIFINTNISTEAEGQWKVSPVLLYDENGVINEHFNTHGIGRTFHLMCSASSFTTKEQTINWCIKKTENANWTKVVTQEDEIKSSSNKNGEIIMFSRITYHVTEYDKVLTFSCEISASSSSLCGSGLSFTSHKIWINAHQTIPSETKRSSASVAVLSVLLCLVLITVVALVIITYRRGKLTIFGIVFKIERSNHQFQVSEDVNKVISVPSQSMSTKSVSKSSVRYIEEPIKRSSISNSIKTDTKNEKEFEDDTQGLYEEAECNLAVQRQSFYENEALKNENLNEVETSKHIDEPEICDYDELHIEGEQQDYEDLKL
ncbi:uncharacterized protein LOC133194069 [Saccostrea echinata]|uniref:uncharacterized protein LOC133194069 n=1 Tax=Saccostrea echinata TaxID=191078 RepID=UPI002A82AEEC|nr:uncharacterized protein LOC133194069 [Saccostrea echinata]